MLDPDDDSDPFGALLEEQEHDRRWRAFHEGGHLAAAFVLDAYLLRSDIVTRGERDGVAVYRLGYDGQAVRLEEVTIAMAGPIAARRHAPWHHDGGANDRKKVDDCLAALANTPAARAALQAHCRREAEKIIETNWDLVEAFAEALLVHVTIDDVGLAAVADLVMTKRQQREWKALVARAAANPFPPLRCDVAEPTRCRKAGAISTSLARFN